MPATTPGLLSSSADRLHETVRRPEHYAAYNKIRYTKNGTRDSETTALLQWTRRVAPEAGLSEPFREAVPILGDDPEIERPVGSVPEACEAHGRIAGQLLGKARSAHTVDALVVAHAVEAGGAHILTGDRENLERLAASRPEVWIHTL